MDVRDEILIVISTRPAKLSNVELLSSLEKKERIKVFGKRMALGSFGWLGMALQKSRFQFSFWVVHDNTETRSKMSLLNDCNDSQRVNRLVCLFRDVWNGAASGCAALVELVHIHLVVWCATSRHSGGENSGEEWNLRPAPAADKQTSHPQNHHQPNLHKEVNANECHEGESRM